jgi:cellobiose transport system substrate-binding protein
MRRTSSRLVIATAVLATVSLVGLAACSSGNSGESSKSDGPITLTLNDWGQFGLEDVAAKYHEQHPNITIQINNGDYDQQHQNLQKYLVAGTGAPDIAMMDEGYIVQFRGQANKFVDLNSLGAADYKANYLDWKWQQGQTVDGKGQFAIGDDVGGLAMCYRTDLFKAAGLPTDRDQVSALWPTWDGFINVGKQYVQASGKKFVDAGVSILNPVLAQQKVGYIDSDEKLAMDQGPKAAWQVATKVIDDGLSANLPYQTADWNAGMRNGDFAVLACPSWMMGYIQGQAPGTSGKWDVANVPGSGGNWGGSFFAIPTQGKHIQEAWDFIKFAIAPEQQISVFQKVGLLPAQPSLYGDPALKDFKNPFFSNAPVGQIFTTAALKLKPQYLGKKSGPVRVAVENVLTQVQQGKLNASDGWDEAVKQAKKAAEG